MAGQARIRIGFEKNVTKWFDYLMVSKQEMRDMLEGTGWNMKKSIDSDGLGYVAVIEKTPLTSKKLAQIG